MANYAQLKSDLDSTIKTNIRRSITGDLLNDQLDAMIGALGLGWQYMGMAVPSTDPGSPDARVVWLAATPGAYVNFGDISLTQGKLAFLRWDGSWHKDEFSLSVAVDSAPTEGSVNPVQSGGVYTALAGKESLVNRVTTLSPESDDAHYPTARCVYDMVSALASPFEYEVVTSLPTASASTMGTVYVVTGADSSVLWLTSESGGSYSWKEIGEVATAIETVTTGEIDALFN